jgi:hypothetical protein
MINIINWTHNLKTSLNLSEQAACHKALYDCILPRLSGIDNTGFKDILKDLFQGEAVVETKVRDIEPALVEVMAAYGFISTDKIMQKTYQMHDLLLNHRSLILLGTAGIGKSSILRM